MRGLSDPFDDGRALQERVQGHCFGCGTLHDLSSGPPPFAVVTGSLHVNYLKPVLVTRALELRARIVEHGKRKSVVACRVLQDSVECAAAEVITVRINGMD